MEELIVNNLELINKYENELKEIFDKIDKQALSNSNKVIEAFHKYKFSERRIKNV